MTTDTAFADRVHERLVNIYGDRAETVLPRVLDLVARHESPPTGSRTSRWDERDVVLIAYADQVSEDGQSPLSTLQSFLAAHGLDECIGTLHILPFYPYSSDDGFSVIDYRAVDPAVGTWDDVRRLNKRVDLMFDLVLNHASQHSRWFQDYLAGGEPFSRFFIDVDPNQDLSAVTRPRSLPLLTPFETSRGTRHLWTTFSADQIDLNFAEPEVLVEMLDVLLCYVRRGARFVRLDAIAYLWKEIGTSCIHLRETHEVVKLMRDVLDAVAPHVVLLTETNVPHDENVSYFGQGDEAHMVYQFSLPPLLLEAMLSHDAEPLKRWLLDLEATRPGTTYFNFTASHDGVGVRPLEGLVSEDRFVRLVDAVKRRGGLVSTNRNHDGTHDPYELNITYLDALGDPDNLDPRSHARRFLTSQAIMLSLRGIPGVYFHSLVGTPNDLAGVESSGQPRRINRRKYGLNELSETLSTDGSAQQAVFQGYQQLLRTRIAQPAFHPDADQTVFETSDPAIVAFSRTSPDGGQSILVAANLGSEVKRFKFSTHTRTPYAKDLLSDRPIGAEGVIDLEPYQIVWAEAFNAG
ncbi:MAG: sugar phosphorylase [Pirellulaceae bacterium]|nr:sugar phosphorylase [Pirellulaceae bacterium]